MDGERSIPIICFFNCIQEKPMGNQVERRGKGGAGKGAWLRSKHRERSPYFVPSTTSVNSHYIDGKRSIPITFPGLYPGKIDGKAGMKCRINHLGLRLDLT